MEGEQITILNNILSLLNELKQMEAGEQTQESNEIIDEMPSMEVEEELGQKGDELEMPTKITKKTDQIDDDDMIEDEDLDDEDKKLFKELVETKSDVAVANDDAEDRIESFDTSVNEDAIDEVAKAMVKLLKRDSVKKSVKGGTSREVKILTKVVKQLANRTIEQEKAISNILKGFGIADEVMKSASATQKVQKGLNSTGDVNKTLEYIAGFIKDKAEVNKSVYEKPIEQVRKTLSNPALLKAILKD